MKKLLQQTVNESCRQCYCCRFVKSYFRYECGHREVKHKAIATIRQIDKYNQAFSDVIGPLTDFSIGQLGILPDDPMTIPDWCPLPELQKD